MPQSIVISFNAANLVSRKFGKGHAFNKITVYGKLDDPSDFIKAAAAAQVVLRIKYVNREGRILYRWIEPYSYRTEHRRRFLYALCRLHNHIHKWIPGHIMQATFAETGLRYRNPEKIPIEIGKKAWVGTNAQAFELKETLQAIGDWT